MTDSDRPRAVHRLRPELGSRTAPVFTQLTLAIVLRSSRRRPKPPFGSLGETGRSSPPPFGALRAWSGTPAFGGTGGHGEMLRACVAARPQRSGLLCGQMARMGDRGDFQVVLQPRRFSSRNSAATPPTSPHPRDLAPDDDEDLFAHLSAVRSHGLEPLVKDQRVCFDVPSGAPGKTGGQPESGIAVLSYETPAIAHHRLPSHLVHRP